MFSIETRSISYLLLLILFVSPLHAAIELSFYNDIPDTPQETITFASSSLFYTGVLPHIDEFICASDSPTTETVSWFDARGNEVNEGDGSGSSLYWTGSAGIKTLHTSDSQDNNLIDVDNQGNNFTCRVSGTSEEKYFGIYWVRAILGASGVIADLRGMRIYTKDDPPIISEFTLQRGFFNLDFSKQYKVQSLKGSTTITFAPLPTEPVTIPASSVIDNVIFSSSSDCQSIGTSDGDILYTSLFNGYYLSRTVGGINLPEFSESACTGNDTMVELSLGNDSPDLRFTCPLVFNGNFLDIDGLGIDTGADVIASLPGSSELNKRRIWINLDNNVRVTLRYDREYVCRDMYGTTLSFRARVDAITELEVFDSDTTFTPAAGGSEYITNQTTLYCLSDSNLLHVEWYVNSNPNSSEITYTLVSDDTNLQVYASNPRVGRSDLVVIPDPPSDMQGYFYCRDSMGRNLSYSIFSQTPVSPVAIVTPNATQVDVTIGINQALICGFSNSPHPTNTISYWEDTVSDTLNSNQFLEINSGIYTCISSNVFGRTSVTIDITVIPPAPSVTTLLLGTEYNALVDESFEVFCEFSTLENVTSFISITWYHNGTINLGPGTITNNNGITGSTLTINDAAFSDSGDYHCVATVGSSLPSNSTPTSITVVIPYAPDAITLSVSSIEYFSVVVSWNGTDRDPPLTETYSISVSRVGSSEVVNLTVSMESTNLTIPNLLPNSVYEVYVVATNRFFTTQGSNTSFETSSLRLYFIHRNGYIVPIGAGSIFRGGIKTEIQYDVTEFHCFPNAPEQVITWYQPNGDVIPTGTSSSSGFYSTRDMDTGESLFYPNNAISYDNDGDNFTCSFMDTSGETIMSSFGIYYTKMEKFASIGNRLYGQDNLIYEFVYQRGVFDFNFTQSYTVECLRPSLPTVNNWDFIPTLLSTTNIMTTDAVLRNVLFDPSDICQYIQCAPTIHNIAFSNQPFFIQTVTNQLTPLFQDCLENNHEFTYQFGNTIDIRITCPLVFGAHFLDVANITQIQGDHTDSRRLWFDPNTVATFQLDREFVCKDMYGETASFRIIVNGIEEIQVLANTSSSVGITNNTNLIGNAEIPNSLLCVTQDNNNAATWYVDSNPNRNTAVPVPVTANTTQMPHVVSPRNGRSDLILDGTIRDGAEGFYSCVTNPQIRLGIFLEMPVSPVVAITGNPQNIQVIITMATLILVCDSTNMPYPNPIYFWTGNVNFTTALLDTSLLLDTDTGVYTCTGSNVVGLSVDTINITVIPPPPQFSFIRLVTTPPVYVSDSFTIQCQFSTLVNVTSVFSIEWFVNGALVVETGVSIATSTSTGVGTSELTVTDSVLSQEGDYSCRARVGGSGPTDSDIFSFNFDFPPAPIISINPVDQITEYITQDVTITCLFTTLTRFQDKLSINWYQDGTMIGTNGNIQISRMDLSATTTESILAITSLIANNAGMYHCVAQILDVLNSEETMSEVINLQVIGPPTPVVRIDSENPITDYITQDVSITCLVTTLDIFQDALNVDWYQDGTMIGTNGNIQISTMNLNTTTTESILTITSLVVDNAGMYHCVAQIIALINSEETMSNVINLQVIGPPTPVVRIDTENPITDYITQDISITCLVTTLDIFQDALNVDWYQDGTMIGTNGNIQISTMNLNTTTTESILTITSLVVDNAGMYHCVAQIIALINSEEAVSNVITVNVTGPPAPIVSISPVDPIVDYITQNVTITCLFTTFAQFQAGLMVDWYQNGTMIGTNGNIIISTMNLTATTTESILTITSLMVDNAGMYHCVAQIIDVLSSTKAMSDTITIDVTGPPAPIVSISPVDPIVDYITQNVTITCFSTTQSRFQSELVVVWYQNGAEIDTGGNIIISTMILNSTTTESILAITSLVVDNAGAYHCVGQIIALVNSEEAMSNAITVGVIGAPAPIVTISAVNPIVDYITQNVAITCFSTTQSQFQSELVVNWYQNGTKIDTGGNIIISTMNLNSTTTESILAITSLVVDNAGMYYCVAQIIALLNSEEAVSDIITIDVTGPPAPIISISPVDTIVDYITQNVTITCFSTTQSQFQAGLMVDWYQNGTMVNSGNIQISTMNLDATTTETILTITSLVVENAGTYHCVSYIIALRNSEDTTSDIITVNVTGPPAPMVTIDPVDPITEYTTQDVTITCLFTTLTQFQDKLSINWYQDGTMIGTNGNIQISRMDLSATTTESILAITSLIANNAGMYHCVAQILDILNSEETMSDVINLQVIGPPTPVVRIDSENLITDYITQDVSITCLVTTLDIFQDALNVDWYQDGTMIGTNGNIQISTMNLNATTTESMLTITSLVVDNAGMYHCVAHIIAPINSEEVVSDVITVYVTGPPAPIVTISPVDPIVHYITQNVTITCQFTTFAQFQESLIINWYQNGTIVTSLTPTLNHLNDTTTRSEIFIMNLVLADAGEYNCVAQIVGVLNSELVNISIPIQPIAPPAPTLGFDRIYREYNFDLYQDFTFHLHCNFTTVDVLLSNLDIDWFHDDSQVLPSTSVQISNVDQGLDTKDSILTIQEASLNNSGNYYCEGRIGSFNSTRYPNYLITIYPTVEIPDIGVTVSNMDTNSVTLSLTPSQVGVAMVGLETYVIYYRIAGSGDPYQVYDANTNLSFTIPDLMPETEYEYIIQTTNEFGSTNSSSNMVSTNADATAAPIAFEAIIGAVIVILIFAIIVVVLLLLLMCWRKRRGPKQPAVINQRYARTVQSSSSERRLLTKNTGVGDTFAVGQSTQPLHESEKPTTFRRAAVQETALMNIETGAAEPLYEDFSYERYNVPIGEFSQKVLEYHLANNAEFDRQFSVFRKDFIHDVTTGSNLTNKPKNRFANIIPYEHSRVKLNVTGENQTDYINACYIDGYYQPQSYIAAQGPMTNTVNDFWRLVWEKNIEHIVALTRVMEALKKKCEQYWPELENNSATYGPIEVTLKRIDRFTSYDIRLMEIKHQDYLDDTRSVIQFHFIVWPDHGVPIFSSSLLTFINHTKEYHIPGKQEAPLLVHCSAGVGRTGTFIVLDYFIEHLKVNDRINVYKMVAQLREARCLMVQTKDQFMFIHDAIQDLITCKDTFVSDHEFHLYLENALIRDLKTMTTPFEDKYELIMRTSRIIDPRDTNESSEIANVMKNRYPNFVPFDSHRVSIIPDQDGDRDYINASFVHSYQRHKGFIAAQSPLDFTVYDFWKMITKHRILLVVMLSELYEDGHEMSAKYWPEEGKEMLVHYLIIRCEKEEIFDDFVRRKIVVSTEQGGINQSIQQIQFKKWKLKELPEINDVLTLYHQFNQVERGLKSKEAVPILVHCDNGSTRTGTFIASINAIQQLELERKVDIFQIVRNLRNSRPCMVPSLDLYIFIFKLIASYIQSYEEKAYANFV